MAKPHLEQVHNLLKRSESPPISVVDLLKHTVIGTNGLRYQLLDTEEKIHALNRPHFLYLERNGEAIGNVTICKRQVKLGNGEIESLYLRYFAFKSIFQGGNKKGKSNSLFHEYFKQMFETANFNPCAPIFEKSIYWAFIDPENLRSFNMNEKLGFETIGTFKTFSFSRSRPKGKSEVSKIKAEEQEATLKLIQHFYKDHHFFSAVHLFKNNNYYVYKVDGEIVAGIQANPIKWKILSLPGKNGKLLKKLIPFIPGLRKIIRPEKHQFLATEGLFWKNGFEHLVPDFLEGVLSITGHHSLLIWKDHNDKRLENLKIHWGILERIKSEQSIHFVAKFNGFDQGEIDQIRSGKKYLSGFDMT